MTDSRKSPTSRRACLAACGAWLFAAAVFAAPPANGVPSESLAITGAVKDKLTLKVADLQALPTQLTLQTTARVDGKEVASSVRGVPLTALLDRAALADAGHNDWKHTVVVATGTDGYGVAFSWSELFNTEVGPSVLVIHERDGKPLEEHEGRIALVSGKDLRAGPRNVHWLTKIDVRILGS